VLSAKCFAVPGLKLEFSLSGKIRRIGTKRLLIFPNGLAGFERGVEAGSKTRALHCGKKQKGPE